MNLAVKDIRHNFVRFVLTTAGIGLLLMLIMGMQGIYRGLVREATVLLDAIGADLWVVEKGSRGPFAEPSRVPESLEDRLRVVPGVARSRSFISRIVQQARAGRPHRLTLLGLSWPDDRGADLPLVAGRPLGQAHFEMIADELLGFRLGERVAFGKDSYTVVGLTRSMVSLSGDGMAFLTAADVRSIDGDLPGEATRMERESRYGRARGSDIGHTQPSVVEGALGPETKAPAGGGRTVGAVSVKIAPGWDPAAVAAAISAWPDVTARTYAEEKTFLLDGAVERARMQLGFFRILLIAISAIIMALILYTLTLDKLHDIAMLKLIGAPNRTILRPIIEQALLLGGLGLGLAWMAGRWIFPLFPRRVVVLDGDMGALAAIVVAISVLSTALGIARAMRVAAEEVVA